MDTFFKHDMPGRVAEKRDKAKARERQWQATRKLVLVRDRYRCRVCASAEQVDVHHIRLRSAGGEDVPSNLAAMCRACHELIHLHKLTVRGNGDKALKVTR
jgi:5-methylcytosine-specific restriction endonuclease McrA